jgi:hypothetical protein
MDFGSQTKEGEEAKKIVNTVIRRVGITVARRLSSIKELSSTNVECLERKDG